MPPDLDPARYVSPSGHFVLHVDPTERDGAGPADCRLDRAGETVWEKRLPFTFREAVVSDGGLSCGYAYTEGRGPFDGGGGELVLAMVDSSGEVVMREGHAREPAGWHSPDAPTCAGVHLLPQARQVIARVDLGGGTSSETWWVFDLDRRVRDCTVPMKSTVAGGKNFYGTYALRSVAGTPLLLVQWRCVGGAGFTLLDEDFAPVWSLSLPSDYRAAMENREVRRVWRMMYDGAGIPPSASGTFAVWRFADRELVTYATVRKGTGWSIQELERQPRELEEPAEPQLPDPPPIELAPLGVIDLRSAPPAPEEHWLAWSPDQDGIEGIHRQPTGDLEWTRLDLRGETVKRLPIVLPADLEEGGYECCRLADGRWLVTLNPFWVRRCWAWTFQPETGELLALPAFDCPDVEALAGDLEGGFVVIWTQILEVGTRCFLTAHDVEGRRRWWRRVGDPEDVAVTGSGEVAVLDVARHEVAFYSHGGPKLRTVDLDAICGQELTCPSRLEVGPEGELLVHDFRGDPPLWLLDGGVAVVATLRPCFRGGHAPKDLARWARFSPDGRLWSRAEGVFVRLGSRGAVESVVGGIGPLERINEPDEARCGLDGRLYVFDRLTGVVHVFDGEGEPLHGCVPEANDHGELFVNAHLAIDSNGRVFASRDVDRSGYVHYDRNGRRVAIADLPGKLLTFLPGSTKPWAEEYDSVALLDSDASVAFELERHADRTWLRHIDALAAGSDGSLLVYDGRITIRARVGGLRTLDADPARPRYVNEMAGGGGWIALASREHEVHLVHAADGAAFRFDLTGIHLEGGFDLTTPPDGSELWVFDRERRAFLRYAWPED